MVSCDISVFAAMSASELQPGYDAFAKVIHKTNIKVVDPFDAILLHSDKIRHNHDVNMPYSMIMSHLVHDWDCMHLVGREHISCLSV